MGQSTYLKTPKKGEEDVEEENHGEVPNIQSALASAYNMKAHPTEDEVIMDELEGILGIEDDENLPGDVGAESIGQLDLELGRNYLEVNWEGEFSTTQSLEDADFWDGNGFNGIKAESSSGYWDFDDDKASLNLSLNYQEVLEAWSNRGSLWASSNTYMGEVPVMEEGRMISTRRQASVMRYKEKRQSRLPSKRIRYEVRKLNADKRPRIKMNLPDELCWVLQGRFVKRVVDKMQRGR